LVTNLRKTAIRSVLLSSVSLFAPLAAYAQSTADTGTESLTVTGTLISRPGFQAPTPVTSVSSADLEVAAPTTLVDQLSTLPQFGSAVTNHAGYQLGNLAGSTTVNLRNLGTIRTLVLVNGERVVSSQLTNVVDFNLLPSTLIKRVDVVTGGASASYGSDAVAGVVNIILDTDFEGFKAEAQYGNNRQNAYETYKYGASAGTSFDGDRGHIMGTISYFDSPQIYTQRQTDWYTGSVLMLKPGSTTQLIHANHVGLYGTSTGGVITSGPLKNTVFLGQAATPTAYAPGNISGILSYGGDAETSVSDYAPVAIAQRGWNAYTYAKYKLTPNITAHLEADYGYDGGESAVLSPQNNNNITISIDNPYIPAQTRAQMTALGLSSFLLGSNNMNIASSKCHCSLFDEHRQQTRINFGLDGSFDGWTWNAYYGHGETHARENWLYNPYVAYYNNAVDAVIAPVGNAAGIAPGSITCRSTLTNPTNGCKPMNVFGFGNVSAAAINYVTPQAWTQINNSQDSAAASFSGDPFSLWAGAVSVAGGAAWRQESAVSFSDALTETKGFVYGNNADFNGSVSVYELFLETAVPLAKNESWAQDLEFNAAGRYTNYSTSGGVETWKLGLSNQVNDEIRLRATWSDDIRAPNLSELFAAGVTNGRTIPDPFTGAAPSVRATSKGNVNLKPENATTITGGIVYTPNWLEGFSLSVDWYYINIKGAIGTLSAEQELAYCFAAPSTSPYCPLIIRSTDAAAPVINGLKPIVEIDSVPSNNSFAKVSGLDIEAGYNHELWGGNLGVHAVANYTDEATTVNATGLVTDNAGSVAVGGIIGAGGEPKFKSTITATYNFGPWSGTVQTRLISSARLLSTYDYTPGAVDNNAVPWVGYLDLRASYNFNDNWQLYGAMDNAMNIPPPNAPGTYNSGSSYYAPTSPGTVYDLLGRTYRIGFRANY
jgi:iron complex outermembrane receptor protein